MVSPQHEEVFRILDLVGQHQADSLDRLLSSVHVVPQEEIVAFTGEARVLEQFYEIGVLSVDVS